MPLIVWSVEVPDFLRCWLYTVMRWLYSRVYFAVCTYSMYICMYACMYVCMYICLYMMSFMNRAFICFWISWKHFQFFTNVFKYSPANLPLTYLSNLLWISCVMYSTAYLCTSDTSSKSATVCLYSTTDLPQPPPLNQICIVQHCWLTTAASSKSATVCNVQHNWLTSATSSISAM
jgi:hypothetical protein